MDIFKTLLLNNPPNLALEGQVSYQGTWDASANSPTLASGVGTKGYYYVVSVNGSTNLDGLTDWKAGDWAIFNGSAWQKVDNTDQVSSVFGRQGAVVGVSTDYSAVGITNTAIGATNPSTGGFTSITGNSLTAPATTDLVLQGGSTGASVTLGQGTNANVTLTPSGTGFCSFLGKTAVTISPATAGYQYGIRLSDESTTTIALGLQDTGAISYPSIYGNTGISFGTNGANRMRLNSSGNLLIATTTDSSNGKLQLATHTTSTGGIGFGTDVTISRNSTGGLNFGFPVSATTNITNLDSQIVLFSGSSQLQFRDSSCYIREVGGLTIGTGTSYPRSINLKTNDVLALTIDTSQQVKAVATTDSTSTTTGALVTSGGLGVAKKLFVGDDATFSNTIVRNGSAGSYRVYNVQSSGVSRWAWGADNAAESGSNAGSDFVLYSFNDAGSVLTNPVLKFTRSTSATTLAGNLAVNGGTISTTSGQAMTFPQNGAGAFIVGNSSEGGTLQVLSNNISTLSLKDAGGSPYELLMRIGSGAFEIYDATASASRLSINSTATTVTGNLTVSGTGSSSFAGNVISSGGSGTGSIGVASSYGVLHTVSNAPRISLVRAGSTANARVFDFINQSDGVVNLRFISDDGNSAATAISIVGNSSATSYISVPATTDSSSTTTGSIVTSGGLGVAKNLYVGGTNNKIVTTNNGISQLELSNLDTTGTSALCQLVAYASGYSTGINAFGNGYTTSRSARSNGGRLFSNAAGGLMIVSQNNYMGFWAGNPEVEKFRIYNSGTIGAEFLSGYTVKISDTTDSSSTTTGALVNAGGIAVAGQSWFGNYVTVDSTTGAAYRVRKNNAASGSQSWNSTLDSNGNWIFQCANDNFVGANTAFTFTRSGLTPTGMSIAATTDSTSSATGALITSGGLGVAKNATVGGNIIASAGSSASPSVYFSGDSGSGFYSLGTKKLGVAVNSNIALAVQADVDGSSGPTVYVKDLATAPTANPTGGGYLFCQNGALKWRGSSGTVTTIAAA